MSRGSREHEMTLFAALKTPLYTFGSIKIFLAAGLKALLLVQLLAARGFPRRRARGS